MKEIRPHAGPQWNAFASSADIVFVGGAAGGGKTFFLSAEPLRHAHNPRFRGVLFRRTTPEITYPGGLMDETAGIYPDFGGSLNRVELEWSFTSGSRIKMAHLQHESDKRKWLGAAAAYFGFDQVETFLESQFTYVALSRGRSTSGIRPYVRGTLNPVPPDDPVGGWLHKFVGWYLDDEGYADPAKSGVLRWFYRVDDKLRWYASEAEAMSAHPKLATQAPPKSFTFIPFLLSDNPTLDKGDPGYRASLLALPLVERQRLLGDPVKGGNWFIRPTAGNVFNRAWFEIVDAVPAGGREVRYWDKAGTDHRKTRAKAGHTDKDNQRARTAGVKMKRSGDLYFITGAVACQLEAFDRNRVIHQTAEIDGRGVEIWVEQEPGSGGKESAQITIRQLAGWNVQAEPASGAKPVRWGPVGAQALAGNVKLLRGAWNEDFLDELHRTEDKPGVRKDYADALAGAFNKLALPPKRRHGGQAAVGAWG